MSKTVNTTIDNEPKERVSDAVIDAQSLKEKVAITKNKRVPFKCEVVYNALYPNGFESTYQGIQVLLIFDGRTVELPEAIIDFVKKKIEKKAISEMEKKRRNADHKSAQTFLGNYQA